ncbi:MAG: TRAP transporter small permease subunit [Thiofilum sp.]|uniref:TRAP transporter small permease n=1 Tax=Thiofilum sp. TaxID=2212733 RepID=UPI0025CCD8A1|nr:TRAP transporter small permease subunit [Thiofilum sp.]MBK8452122.1 TRAP transporter small permease subunit [Thiofilum sp.]
MLKILSDKIAQIEIAIGAILAGAVTLLIILNIVSRTIGQALYWVDELAIYCMVWMTLITTAAILKKREGIAVTLLIDVLPHTLKKYTGILIDFMVLVFGVTLLVLTFRWLSLWSFAHSGFNIETFQSSTFNFIYSENTNTLGIKKIWVWLPLVWVSISLTLHALTNLLSPVHTPHPHLEESI